MNKRELAPSELIVSVTVFKAQCLELFKRLESGKLRRIVVTRRGRAIVDIVPPEPATKRTFTNIHGCMRGMITIAPGVDLTEPVGDPEDWNAVRGVLLSQDEE